MAERVDSTVAVDVPIAPPVQATQGPPTAGLATGDGEARSPDYDDPRLYVNRELSLLSFFERVLEEAQDERNKLLERVKFLAIVASNLAEFFMVRVAGLKEQIDAGVSEVTADGMTPAEQLVQIRLVSQAMMNDSRVCLDGLLEHLREAGIHVLDYDELDARQCAVADAYYNEIVFPVLTPLAVDPGRPFPHISNMSLSIAVFLRDEDGDEQFARIKVPDTLPRLVRVPPPEGEAESPRAYHLVWLEQVVGRHLEVLFPGMEIVEHATFRVVRDAEMEIQELEAEDLLETVERGVRSRRFGSVVRLTVESTMSLRMRDILIENLDIEPVDVYVVSAPLGLTSLWALCDVDRPDLKDAAFVPAVPIALDKTVEPDIFAAIRKQDVLLHVPYHSFSPVLDFLETAARDANVLAIKMTLYRVGRRSPVVASLLEAARNGKQVAVLLELKARFDEESNIEWARALEAEGVHVVYGLLGLKTHSKLALVVRKEGDRIRRYVHLATGNYNAVTAQTYTDLGLFTCDEDLGADVSDLFNLLTGYSRIAAYRRLLVAPTTMRTRLVELIRREIEHQQRGEQGHLIFKINHLVDKGMIKLLYEASRAGVRIDLLVRGVCSLRPGVPGISDTIQVISIVGRFLEHTRIYYFRNAGDEEVLLGSADLMPRNLNRRVEVLFPVLDQRLMRVLRDDILGAYLADNQRARRMRADGGYDRVQPAPGDDIMDVQECLIGGGGLCEGSWG
jgi:polyphosphate kinase